MTFREIAIEMANRLNGKQLKDIETNDLLEELEKIDFRYLTKREQEKIIYIIKILTTKQLNDKYIHIFELEKASIKKHIINKIVSGESTPDAFVLFSKTIAEKILDIPQEEINKFKNKLNLKSDEEILKELYKYYLISRKRIKKERKRINKERKKVN